MELKKVKTSWFVFVSWCGLYLFIWWVLTDGTASSWWIGVPAVLVAVTVSIGLIPPVPLIWLELFKFVPFFLLHSLLGGADVARRVFQGNLSIAPDLIEYPYRLPPGLPLMFMINIVNLLPGTLVAEFDQSMLKVHVLDRHKDFMIEIEMVELRVARIFGTTL